MTKTQQEQEKLLEELRPARKTGKESNFYPKTSLFNKEKTYLVRGAEHKAPADWRKFSIGGKEVILFKGKPLLEDEYQLIVSQGRAAVEYFIEPIEVEAAPAKKAKAKKVTSGE